MLVTSNPATRPCNKFATLGDGIPSNSFAFTTEIEPVASRLVVEPYATTTVSSNACISSSITICREVLLVSVKLIF